MRRKKVVIVANGSLLLSGIVSLVREAPEIEALAVRQDSEDFYDDLRAAAPEVIVVDAAIAADDEHVSVARLLRDCPRARIVAVGVDRPEMAVYRSRRVKRASVRDFLATLLGRPQAGSANDERLSSES